MVDIVLNANALVWGFESERLFWIVLIDKRAVSGAASACCIKNA
jgi:hypothetical protein